jgi:saccharopine dehydrogenase (NADP+, L-glutamate forming)
MLGVDVDSAIMYKLKWTGIFEDEPINLRNATPAKILEHRLTSKWQMAPEDRDMIIMQHEFDYTLDNKEYKLYSTLVMKGQNQIDTAMSRLVGLPLGVFVKLVLDGQIAQSSELHIPVTEDIYRPVLKELEQYGVKFEEEERVVRLGVN